MSYINSLTGLRGMAAWIVFIAHCANQGMLPAIFGNGFGQIGVMLFFVLSGFLMGHLYLGREANLANIERYLLARMGRIFPLYFFLIALSVLISSTIYPDFHYHITDAEIVTRALLFIDAPYEFWTIPVEVQFYAVFVIFWILHDRNSGALAFAILITLTVIPSVILYSRLGYVPALFSSYSLPFFIGIGTALAYPHMRGKPFFQKLAAYIALPSIFALLLNLPALRLEHGWVLDDSFFVRTWADPINWLIVYSLFLCALLNARALNFLNARPFVLLGEISFGFYLIHYPVLKIIKSIGVPVPFQFVTSAVAISLMAWLSYRHFEQPASQMLREKLSRTAARPAEYRQHA
jgi:peptidoglycan/LPS O-acetylase OafA/YrhL